MTLSPCIKEGEEALLIWVELLTSREEMFEESICRAKLLKCSELPLDFL
jgi:hypothetical protein